MQRGRVYEASGKFYVQYRVAGRQVSTYLCDKSPAAYSKSCKSVQLKCAEFMLSVNKAPTAKPLVDMLITDFWEQRFVPWATEITSQGRPRLKHTTQTTYRKVWNQRLKSHFAGLMLSQYTAIRGTAFLDGLTSTQGQRSLHHIRAVASVIFKRACAEGRIAANPWRDVVMPASAIKNGKTPAYTWQEAKQAIVALEGRQDCQLILALCCFQGLRPNEVVALRWEDLDGEWLHIRRGMVNGRLDIPKTQSSANSIPLLPDVRRSLEIYAEGKKEGWMFPSEGGFLSAEKIIAPEMKHLAGVAPIDLHNLVVRVIRPTLESRGLEWKPLKAGRTGTCTQLIEKTGNLNLAQRILRHRDKTTTLRMYDQGISNEAALAGVRSLQLPGETK